MFKNMKIGLKILLVMLLTALGALLIIAIISFTQMLNLTKYSSNANAMLGGTSSQESTTALMNQAEDYLKKIVVAKADYYDMTLREIGSDILAGAGILEKLYSDPNNFEGHMLPRPDQTTEGELCAKAFLTGGGEMDMATREECILLSNAEIGLGPIFKNNPVLFNFYLGTQSGISYRYSPYSDYNPDYDPRERNWYKATFNTSGDKATWVDTYTDEFGTVCVTCAAPFKGYNGNTTQGVIATDISMDTMTQSILNTKIGDAGYAFLLDSEGMYIAHPNYLTEGFETDPSVGADKDKLACINAMKAGQYGVKAVTIGNEEYYVAYAPIKSTGWSLGIVVPINEVVAPAVATKEKIDAYADESSLYIEKVLGSILVKFIVLFAACTMLFVLFAFILSNTITKPIVELTKSVVSIGKGDWDIKVPVKGKDEVGELAETFNNMTDSLKQYVADLTKMTAEKERIGAELNVAKKIQAEMLPMIFPPFPERPEFDIYASMDPAKEVGGDFYDFFMIDDTHVALNISDVSGKGVPAALVMVIGKTLINLAAQEGLSAGEVLSRVNDHLCANSIDDMFITSWLGIMDLKTGVMTCANAGHEYPTLFKKSSNSFELIKDKHGLVLGGMEGLPYREYTIELEEGDKVFVYTDGVPEATNANNELFGTDRMMEALNSNPSGNCKEILVSVRAFVDEFVADAPQFDDLTMLCFEFNKHM